MSLKKSKEERRQPTTTTKTLVQTSIFHSGIEAFPASLSGIRERWVSCSFNGTPVSDRSSFIGVEVLRRPGCCWPTGVGQKHLLQHLQRCSVCHPAKKYFSHPS
jgi:hypothetical protein